MRIVRRMFHTFCYVIDKYGKIITELFFYNKKGDFMLEEANYGEET